MANIKSTVAIFGATGHLGKHIAQGFLDQHMRKNYNNVILFVRPSSTTSPELEQWKAHGNAIVRTAATDKAGLQKQLADVDVVVNVINSAGDDFRKKIVVAMAETNVKVYFPSEFGVDHTVHDFEHPEWDKKKAHFNLASQTLPNTKICRVYAGLFLEDSIGPWFGFDTKTGQYESYGSSREKVSYTSLGDVGRAVANLALIPPQQLQTHVHLSGSQASMTDVANIMRNKSGKEIRTVERPLEENKVKELNKGRPDPSGCLRFLMGEGRINHSAGKMGCDNELINPAETKWKWKTMSDLAAETNGQPWADAQWS